MSFEGITEAPGVGAGSEQLSILRTRYHLARSHAEGRRVLEVACGGGMGLPYLAEVATQVVGVDIEASNVERSARTARGDDKITVRAMDAHDLDFPDDSFDLVLLFEALYYLADPERFLSEVDRVLAPGGVLIITSVNCDWHGFNPSPFSRTYFGAPGLRKLLEGGGFDVDLSVGFEDRPDTSGKAKVLSLVKRVAVRLHLIPKTMKGKEKLKRIVFGKLTVIPEVLTDDLAPLGERRSADDLGGDFTNHKFLYAVATRSDQPA